ncbi:hypothetical protein CDAR_229051 [Caerostris darwini]|uniref:Uncharacterized protein n=1 Tax=Caerostris darwini TaxID=1538125 RepID=A0AAV4RIP1_9ARAC|nr:hypothetical protein CDAR_229051 [Caerostris darwini]
MSKPEGGLWGKGEGDPGKKNALKNVLSLLFCNLQSQGIPSQKIEAMCTAASVIDNSDTPRQAVLWRVKKKVKVMPKRKQWKLETMLTTMEDNVKAHDRERKRIARSKPETRARQNALQRERRALKRQQAKPSRWQY